jgi:long-chain acyl-CoA synthetase
MPLPDDVQLERFLEVSRALTAPGAPFEVVEEEVLGERLEVFAGRPPSLRAVLAGAAAFGSRDHLVFDDGRRIRFDELEPQVASLAAGLRAVHGIGPGDRVAVCTANGPEWILLFWAVTSLDAVLVAMNGWWTGTEMVHALELTEPTLLVMDAKRHARLPGDVGVPTVLVEDGFADLAGHEPGAAMPDDPIDEDDAAILLFTSGTTGRPKAAVLTHRTVIAFVMLQGFIAARGMAMAGITPGAGGVGPARLCPFPLFHVSGLGTIVGGVLTGTTSVWPLGRFDPSAVIDLTLREGIGFWSGAVTHVLRLLECPDIERIDPTSIVGVGVGGSASTPDVIRRTEERFPHLKGTFSSGYGSTETGGLVSYATNAMLRADPACVGPPLPTVEVRILDERGEDVPPGAEGDIVARSPLVMKSYWRHPEADAEALLPGRWVRTGDVGRLEDGVLFLASRRRDLILRGGENIYPFEIENRLEEHPDVVECAVFGVDHPVLGQEVKAVVVVTPSSTVTASELQAFCGEALSSYKVPAHVELRTELLPRNATGKIMKHVLAGEGENTFVEE